MTAEWMQARSVPVSRLRATLAPVSIAAALGAIVLLWGSGSGFRLDLITLTVSYALIALGMYMPLAWAGSLSLAYGAYAAVGAYAVALFTVNFGLNPIVGWVVGPIVAAILAILLGLATSRLTAFHLVAATLLFTVAFHTWLVSSSLLGGPNGIGGLPPLSIFGWVPDRFWLTAGGVVLVLVVAFLIDRVRRSRFGTVVRAIGEAPVAVESSGVRVPRLLIVMLAAGAAIASLGGAFFVTSVRSVTPETFTVQVVFLALFMPVLGGLGTPWGAVLGAALVVQLTTNSSALSNSGTLVLSIAVLLVLILVPRGILGLASSVTASIGRWLRARRGRAT